MTCLVAARVTPIFERKQQSQPQNLQWPEATEVSSSSRVLLQPETEQIAIHSCERG